ncbi:oxidoreductase [Kaistia sp. 32K]|uniref:L-threonate dehydrogenase n=1 Tax=Kaistia sp. 32K TaxID=2795690 RepID=UPI0019388964|nr:L-threonate dehydrogenase [Kaistia sp. 32K]BCP53644.1 oxidoreductase [Kaistia sp. 32K]
MTTKDKPRVSVIGLGSMGYGMAQSLARVGFPVTGYDARPEVVEKFAAEHGTGAASLAEAAADAEIIVLVVVNADQTQQVLLGEGGLLGSAKPDAVIVSCATMAPERARALAGLVAASGRHYVDAPISGGAVRAAEGALTMLVSGPPAALDRARPVLDALSAKLYLLGDEAGIGASFKIVNQLLAGVHIAAASEAIVFAKRLGLDIDRVYEVITASAGNSWMFENRIPHVLEGDYTPRSAVEIFTKDLGIIADISRSEKFATPIASSALQMFLMTAAAGMGKDDDASVARLYAQIAGIELPGSPNSPTKD